MSAATKTVPVKGSKNGKTRTVLVNKPARFYPAEDAPVPFKSRKAARPTAIRSSIEPGTVLILLAGRFRGKRVVFLKQLGSGLLLVTGPFKINGVPLRRVNQAYVIATSTKVDVSACSIDDSINDDFFKQTKDAKKAKKLYEEEPKKSAVTESRIAAQKKVDAKIVAAVKKTPALTAYLSASFALSKGQYPHLLKF
ncbi:ribosomal protein L6e-domain-containing protein [Cladochytrium replicatum]|nr:ribosomal protein L6e-domain-containing protein [Cladochytrium replicatum]